MTVTWEKIMIENFIRLTKIFAALILFLLIMPDKTYAYLDPGTGSYILQVLISMFIAGLFAVKIFWGKIKHFVKNLFSKSKKNGKAENE